MAINLSKIYTPLGFQKQYNFILFFIFAGASVGFVLSRTPFLNLDGVFCRFEVVVNVLKLYAAPGECYEYDVERGYQRVAIILHLATILPAMFLASFQFLPVMRYKLMIMHRIDGYIAITLFLISHAGALMLARNTFGGGIEIQTIVGLMVVVCTFTVLMAYYNIKRLQIEQHRAWMLRTFIYAGAIITSRAILVLSSIYTSFTDTYYYIQPCYKIAFAYKMQMHPTVDRYPICQSYFDGTNPEARAVVRALFINPSGNEEIAAAFDMTFGMSLWLAFFIHVAGTELYLHLTPSEHERLRQVSYHKQVERGMRNPGNEGTTVQRFGDAENWLPKETKEVQVLEEASSASKDPDQEKEIVETYEDAGKI